MSTNEARPVDPAPLVGDVFILKSAAGHWMFDVQVAGESRGGGGGYADQFEALEAAHEAFPYLQLRSILSNEGGVNE